MSNEVKRYIVASKDAHDFDLERIGPLAHERLMVCDTDYAALEAECERWKERCQYNADTAHAVATERDALTAELAAIRSAGGEVVEVVAYLLPDYAISRRLSTCSERKIGEPLMTVAQHQRIVAAMAAELERYKHLWELELSRAQTAENNSFHCALELHAKETELEAARKQSAQAFKDELIKATRAILHPHIEGVFAVFQQQVAGQNHNQEETPNE